MILSADFLAGHIAHRGLHGPDRPENSLAAIDAAVARGLAVELDVQPSSDGVAMVFHDGDLDRLTGEPGPIDDRDAGTLGTLTLLGTEERIPTLAQVLARVAGRVPLLIEVKDRDGALGPKVGPLEDAVIAALDGYTGPVALMSFNPHSVDHLRHHAPHLLRGLVTAAFDAETWPDLPDATRRHLAQIADLDRTEAAFVSHEARSLDMARIAEIKARGLPVLCWTIRSPEEERRARRVADAVTFEGYLP